MEPPKSTVIRLLREGPAHRLHAVDGTSPLPALDGPGHEALTAAIGSISTKDQLQLASLAIENSPEGIVIMDPAPDETTAPRIIFVNEAFCRMTGSTRDEAIGQELRIFRAEEADSAVRDALLHPLCQRGPFEGEGMAFRKNGTEYPLELLLVPIHDGSGVVTRWVAYLKDISDRKAELATLERQALHDVLTQLPNRTLLLDRVVQAILVARRTSSTVALMIMDLDGFKDINDTLGHHYGDVLLQHVARRLRGEIRESDTFARLGGDEFAFVLPTANDGSAAMRVAKKILLALQQPFELEDQRCEVGASIGISLFPDHGNDADTLMRRADAAMYHAKRTSLGASLYSSDLERNNSSALALGAELRAAIENNELRLYYQPKLHLRTGVMTRVEALVRWVHPQKGLLLPDEFIPLAEKSGLIKPLTDWVLNDALRQCSEWRERRMPIHVAVNLSTKTLQDHLLPQSVARLLEKWKLPARSLKLEITESSIMADPPHVFAILSLLQSLGVRLSLDDFGTGYSSLVHLRQLPVDEIKIDKSFVMGMATSAGDTAIVRATIDLAHNLGRQVVAEGVDNERTCQVLASLGCDLIQGYCLSRPLPVYAFEKWLEETAWGMTRWKAMLAAEPVVTDDDDDAERIGWQV